MAINNIDKFNEILKGKRQEITDVIPIITEYGDLKKIYDIDSIVVSIINLLTIPKGTYIFDPELGVGIHKYLFEPLDDATEINILNDINDVISIYEDRVKVTPSISYMTNNRGFNIHLLIQSNKESRNVTIPYTTDQLKEM